MPQGGGLQNEFSRIVDALPALVWTALRGGEVDFVNRRWCEFTGLSADDARGFGWRTAIHPDDLPALLRKWCAPPAAAGSRENTVRLRRSDGNYRWVLFQSAPVTDAAGAFVHWCGIGTDVLFRANPLRDETGRSREFLERGQQLSSTGTFLWRIDSDELDFSDELRRIFAIEHGVPITLERVMTRIHPDDVALLAQKVELARAGSDDLDYEFRLLMPDGAVTFLHTNAYAARDARGKLEIIGATQDITERRRADNALIEARGELERVARITTLGALSASIAHEVGQPLSGIITNAGTCVRLLRADPPNVDAAEKAAQRIVADGKRASDVIARLRSLFGKRRGSSEWLDLNAAVREVVALSANALQRDRVIVRDELDGDLPRVMGDRVQLQQVIVNLIVNAADAMRDIDDRPREIVISTQREDEDRVRLSVQDAGAGIDPLNERQLFEPFYTTKDGGMGVGLSISHSIVERHGGRLWAVANEDHGATFSFSIPTRPD